MWDRIARIMSFGLGIVLFVLGTSQLYLGIAMMHGGGMSFMPAIISAMIALFPGAVFVSYSMRDKAHGPVSPASPPGPAEQADGIVVRFPGANRATSLKRASGSR